MIFVFCSILQANAQSPNIYDYGASYKVKIGDSNEYRYVSINNNGKNYLSSYFQSENGSYVPVNVTTGTAITITVIKINETATGIKQVFVQTKVNNPGKPVIASNNTMLSSFILPAFDNKSIVKKFIEDLSILASNQSINSPNTIQYSIDGDYLKEDYSYNYSNDYFNYNFVSTTKVEWSWKTGWLEYNQVKEVAENGTVLLNYKIERESSNLVNDVINYSITGLAIISVGIVVIVPVFTFYSYKKFAKSPKMANKNISFSQYIKSKGKKKTSNKTTEATGSTKALDMIDEIIKENK